MKPLLLALALCFTSYCSASERECGIEDKALLKYIKSVANRNPGSHVNATSLSATWSAPLFQSVRIEVGGCEHFGLNVTGIARQRGELSETKIFRLVKALARSVLPLQDANVLAQVFDRREFSKGTNEDAEVYSLTIRGFQEFGVSVTRRSGVVEISLGGTGE